jgi:hypothetical protein
VTDMFILVKTMMVNRNSLIMDQKVVVKSQWSRRIILC